MRRLAWLLALGVAGCASRGPDVPKIVRVAACRVGPDGGPPIADRGIGGTGGPLAQGPASRPRTQTAERGIGGTGTPAEPMQAGLQMGVETADRGIGGTGIIGVVTGFGSLCVAGQEVALPERVPVRVDDQPTDADALRAGQVTAVAAEGQAGSLRARAVDVMHVVIGPVSAASAGRLIVAGQVVQLAGATGSAVAAPPGSWVAVSGLRQPDGVIAATRIDPAAPAAVLVRGELVRVLGTGRIGGLRVRLPAGADLPGGWSVTVTGRMAGDVLVADSAKLDVAGESPNEYFGPGIRRYVLEGYISVVPGGFLVNRYFVGGTSLDVADPRERRIVVLERGTDGKLRATDESFGSHTEPARSDVFANPSPAGTLTPGSIGVEGDDARARSGGAPGPHRR